MALTATATISPATVVPGQPFSVIVTVVNDTTVTALASAEVDLGADSGSGSITLASGNPQYKTPLTGSGTTYLAFGGVFHTIPGVYGGTITPRIRIVGSDGNVASTSATVTLKPLVQPPVQFGPILNLRFFENTQNLALI
jgi:hypothetical protein